MDRKKVLDVLNSLKVVEFNGGDEPYILVENSSSNREKLNAVGVSNEVIDKYGDEETFCILALAFSEGYANDYLDGKLVYKDYTEVRDLVSILRHLDESKKVVVEVDGGYRHIKGVSLDHFDNEEVVVLF